MNGYGRGFLDRIDSAIAEGRAARDDALEELRGASFESRLHGLRGFGCALTEEELSALFMKESSILSGVEAKESAWMERTGRWRRTAAASGGLSLVLLALLAVVWISSPKAWGGHDEAFWRKTADLNGEAAALRCRETLPEGRGAAPAAKGAEGSRPCWVWVPAGAGR